jgi:hypothetical protein
MNPKRRRILIEIESAEPLRGRIGLAGAAFRPFVGWLGLLSTVQVAIEDSANPRTDVPGPRNPGGRNS